jgi:hypothetical protein
MLCDAINRNQLAIFLASNIMTGATNMVLPTLTATWQEGFVMTATTTIKLNYYTKILLLRYPPSTS